MQFGAVRWFRRIVGLLLRFESDSGTVAHECLSDGTTETFSALPVRSYASLNVKEPIVKNIDCRSNPVPSHKQTHLACPLQGRESCTSLPESFEPHSERVFACGDLVGESGHEKLLELLVCSCA